MEKRPYFRGGRFQGEGRPFIPVYIGGSGGHNIVFYFGWWFISVGYARVVKSDKVVPGFNEDTRQKTGG